MKQARDGLEEDLKETRDVVEELKDFLTGNGHLGAEVECWEVGFIAPTSPRFCRHRPVLQPNPHPEGKRLDPGGQTAPQPGQPEGEAAGAEGSGGRPTGQHGGLEGGQAPAGGGQETPAGGPGRQVGLALQDHRPGPAHSHYSSRAEVLVFFSHLSYVNIFTIIDKQNSNGNAKKNRRSSRKSK